MWPHHYYYTAVYDVAGALPPAELYLCELMEEMWRGDTWYGLLLQCVCDGSCVLAVRLRPGVVTSIEFCEMRI